jgi:alpha-N-arabinofuranosidase
MFVTPTYHAFRLHAPHLGATALRVEVELGDGLVGGGAPSVSGTASVAADGSTAVTLINRHRHATAEVCVDFRANIREASAQLLTASSPAARNTLEEPDAVAPMSVAVQTENGRACRVELPPHSMATLRALSN